MITLSYPMRSALVTGASKGIGSAIARALASSEMAVAVHYHHDREGAERVRAACGPASFLVQGDIARPEECERMVQEVVDRFGTLNVLVNNAAVAEKDRWDLPLADWITHWRRTLDVNLMGAVNVTHAALRHMRPRREGKIINVASRSAFRGETEYVAYAAAKAALVNFTRCTAKSMAKDGIQAYAIAPGFIRTPMAESEITAHGAEIARDIPSGVIGEPEDVAKVALFLASDLSSYITGSTIDVNGGSYFH